MRFAPIKCSIAAVMHDANLPKNGDLPKKLLLRIKIKKNHKSKIDGLQKLPTRACLFHDFLHFKGCPYINHKISLRCNLYFEHFFGLVWEYFNLKSFFKEMDRIKIWHHFKCKKLLLPLSFAVKFFLFFSIVKKTGLLWETKNFIFKMVHPRNILTTELKGNKGVFYTRNCVEFWFWPLFGKMIAAPPGWSTLWAKFFIWAYSVIIHSFKNMFKVPGGIVW